MAARHTDSQCSPLSAQPFYTASGQQMPWQKETSAGFTWVSEHWDMAEHGLFDQACAAIHLLLQDSIRVFTTAEPFSHFTRLVATFSHLHYIALQVSHLAGENTWADDLSRQREQQPKTETSAHHTARTSLRIFPEGTAPASCSMARLHACCLRQQIAHCKKLDRSPRGST